MPLTTLVALGLVAPAQAHPAPHLSSSSSTSGGRHLGARSAGAMVLRIATFNVRTARATSDRRPWLRRAPDVAREILSRDPGVVALQELGPGRADGTRGPMRGHLRQTTSLLDSLGQLGGERYRLVRSTSYVRPGMRHSTQGARILYDATRYRLLSQCPDFTGPHAYNGSCSFELPLAPDDNPRYRRSAAYAEFAQQSSGRRFVVVSAHLDSRHSRNDQLEARYDELRAQQARFIAAALVSIDAAHLPVLFGGDINSWLTDRSHYAPYRMLVGTGFRDTALSRHRINYAYSTVNHFQVRLRPSRCAAHLDVVLVRGGGRIQRYENEMAPVDRARPSDHNLVVADVVL